MTVIMPDSNMFNNQGFLLIILLIVILQLRQRRVRFSWSLLIMPILISFVTIPLVYSELLSVFNTLVIFIALLMGLGIGILIGKFYEVKIDEKGALLLKGSYIAVFIWIAIILLKMYSKNVMGNTGFIELNLLVSAFLVMTLGAMISRRALIYWRYLQFKKEKTSVKA
ncbi:MAG: DUF1453 domain-containing protein [Methanobacterium sp.]